MRAHRFLGTALVSFLAAILATAALGQTKIENPPFPGDMSPAGIRAAFRIDGNNPKLLEVLPEGALESVRDYVKQTHALGLDSRSGRMPIVNAPTNRHANTNAGDVVGETQSEVSVAVFGDTVVVGWNDSRGFTAGNTLSSYATSIDGGLTFVDGGNVPLALPTDQAFGDTGVDTDEKGNWYLIQIYTRTAGNPDPTAEQNIAVHHGRFNGSGVLVWDSPTQAAIGTAATGNLDKCLIGVDRFTGNVYCVYTRFTAVPQIAIVRSTTLGATWDPQIILDATTTPTSGKQGSRVVCGPGGEVYVAWEKGANTVFCNDAAGNMPNSQGQMAFTRSMTFGASYDPFTVIGTVDHGWLWSGPGDLRERMNEFPDIAVDRSGLSTNGNVYVVWNETAPWNVNNAGGTNVLETNGGATEAGNNSPGTATPFTVQTQNPTGTLNAGDIDYWSFTAVQGQAYFFELDGQNGNCATGLPGTTVTNRNFRFRLFATQSPYPNPAGFPDTLLAASNIASFLDRIIWTAPKSGTFLLRVSAGSSGTVTGTYAMRCRNLTFGIPNPARDARDIVAVRSTNQGLTFSAEQRINDGPAGLEELRPFVTVDGRGHVHAFWHDHREGGLGTNGALTTIYGTTSRDGGVTWSANYPVTDEASFFSFNTLAIPNLGDYNQAAASGDKVFAAWTDQRISTGDVRVPNTNTFSAGLGPEVYTAKVQFSVSTSCPSDASAPANTTVPRSMSFTNTGTVPDRYDYSVTDTQGWLVGTLSGTSGTLQPGASFTVNVDVTSTNCANGADDVTLSVTPVGDADGTQTCHSIVTFTPVADYTITSSAGTGGSISPSGAVSVACGGSQSFTITANACYTIADVLVDGVSVGATGSYTFSNVQANHTISASFTQGILTITASAGAGGTISPSGAVSVACGADQSFAIAADACHTIADVLVDGVSVGAQSVYTFTNVQADHTISASFTLSSYTITASAGTGGSIAPDGAVSVSCGASQSFTITADTGYHILDVLVDGGSVGAVSSHTFTNVTADHTIAASFEINSYTVTVTVVGNGTVTRSPDQPTYAHGTALTLTATADPDWAFAGWSGDITSTSNPLGLVVTSSLNLIATFVDAVPPTVQLISPNGGERLPENRVRTVDWTASDNIEVTSIDLYLSRDFGATYTELVASGLENTGSYDWTVTGPGSDDADDIMTNFLKVVAHDGVNTASDVSDAGFEIMNLTVGVPSLPLDFALKPISPNPAFGSARIEYATPRDANVKLRIVDVQGREVARLVDGMVSAGRHQETWSGRMGNGRVPAGLYFVRLEAGSRVFTRRLAMAR